MVNILKYLFECVVMKEEMLLSIANVIVNKTKGC